MTTNFPGIDIKLMDTTKVDSLGQYYIHFRVQHKDTIASWSFLIDDSPKANSMQVQDIIVDGATHEIDRSNEWDEGIVGFGKSRIIMRSQCRRYIMAHYKVNDDENAE